MPDAEVDLFSPSQKMLPTSRASERGLADDHVQMRPLGWTLAQYDHVFKIGKLKHRHVQREGRMRTHTGRKNAV